MEASLALVEVEPNPYTDQFNELISDMVRRFGSPEPRSVFHEPTGIVRSVTSVFGIRLEYIDFGEAPEGNGKPILFLPFKPKFGFQVTSTTGGTWTRQDHEWLFASTRDDPSTLQRSYKTGGLLPTGGASLPNLFVSARYPSRSQSEALLEFASSPAKNMDLLDELLVLEPEEVARKGYEDSERRRHEEKLREDLQRLSRARRRF